MESENPSFTPLLAHSISQVPPGVRPAWRPVETGEHNGESPHAPGTYPLVWGNHHKHGSCQGNEVIPNCTRVTMSRGGGDRKIKESLSEQATPEPGVEGGGCSGQKSSGQNNCQSPGQKRTWMWKMQKCRGQGGFPPPPEPSGWRSSTQDASESPPKRLCHSPHPRVGEEDRTLILTVGEAKQYKLKVGVKNGPGTFFFQSKPVASGSGHC